MRTSLAFLQVVQVMSVYSIYWWITSSTKKCSFSGEFSLKLVSNFIVSSTSSRNEQVFKLIFFSTEVDSCESDTYTFVTNLYYTSIIFALLHYTSVLVVFLCYTSLFNCSKPKDVHWQLETVESVIMYILHKIFHENIFKRHRLFLLWCQWRCQLFFFATSSIIVMMIHLGYTSPRMRSDSYSMDYSALFGTSQETSLSTVSIAFMITGSSAATDEVHQSVAERTVIK